MSLDTAIECINDAKYEFENCPKDCVSGEGLIKVNEAIYELQEVEAQLKIPSSQRYVLIWHKWHKKKPNKLFCRWDNAFKTAIMQMSFLHTDFNVKMTKDAQDGTALEWIIGNEHAEIIVRTK